MKVGDFVRFVPFPRGSLYGGAERCKTDHKYCINDTMEQWEDEGTVLQIAERDYDKIMAGEPGKGQLYTFNVSDLDFVAPRPLPRSFWFIVDGSVSDTNADIPDILFTRVTQAGSYEEAVDMYRRDLFGLEVCCINADHLSPHTARTYKVEYDPKEQYYVSVEGHENIALSIPVNDS